MKITKCIAKEIADSRGKPTIEVELFSGDVSAVAGIPSGKSTGSKEALEKRDSDGVGVKTAISNVENVIAPQVLDKELSTKEIDELLLSLDGTDNKTNLGANAMLGVSIASTKLAASLEGIPIWKFIANINSTPPRLPKLFMNIMNGGAHADFRLPFQEYMIVPDYDLVSESYENAKKVIEILGEKLKDEFGEMPLGDEGGYSPIFKNIKDPFKLLSDIITSTNENIFLAIDAAASEFYKNGSYNLLNKEYSSEELLGVYKELTNEFNLLVVEDPFSEFDPESFSKLTKEIGNEVLILADDLTVTNPAIIAQMVKQKAGNSVIIKPNQIGTLSEVYEAVSIARSAGWEPVASHRSGETMDTFISDLAVGIGAYGIKAGSPLKKEREVKYKRLIEIEQEFNKYN